jgi:hypothetical protein
MKKLLMILTVSSLFFVSCGSSEKDTKKEEVRTFKKDYNLVDASTGVMPNWIEAPSKGDKSKARKKHRYFVNESAHKSKRLCLKSAEARATARIASEIAQFMKNTFAESTQGGEDEDVTEYMQEQLAQEAQSFIVGARVHRTYWEKRRYLETLGAEEDKTEYNCYALVKMSKKNLEKAVKNSRRKLLQNIEEPEVKQKTDKILKDVSKKFAALDAPVKLEKSDED